MQSDQRLVWWSWADIVKYAHQLGIPNFQRGAVWGVANRTALLESMFEQSPCGSFVLWQPADDGDLRRHGVPVLSRSFEEGIAPMWLVDGQQRTRAMLDTYRQLFAVPASDGWSLVRDEDIASLRSLDPVEIDGGMRPVASDDDDGEAHELRYWGAVLPAMRQFDESGENYFADRSESRGVRRGTMFRRISPTARLQRDGQGRTKRLPPGVPGTLPLVLLMAPTSLLGDRVQRQQAAELLAGLGGGRPDFDALDNLLPWGPQFVTGHAYEMMGSGAPEPMRWADVHRRAADADVGFMISRLVGLVADDKWQPVFNQFRDMLVGGRFAVGWLPRSDVSAAIDAYVRINRAGIRVRQEEQALALLSRAYPRLLDELAEFIRMRDGDLSLEDGRSLLVHESDRHMGFAVWMRTVTRYSALALLGTTACGWLGTTAIEKDTFRYRLGRVGPDETNAGTKTWARTDYADPGELVRECSDRVTRALTLVDSVMSRELQFDHRMARPSMWALTPLIDLLYRVPEPAFKEIEHDAGFRAAIARLLHWSLLAPYLDQADLRRLINDIHGVSNTYVEEPLSPWSLNDDEWRGELRAALGRYQSTLLDLWRARDATYSERRGEQPAVLTGDLGHDFTELGVRAFKADVHESRSLQHPAVGWLYAIERLGGAREFRWDAQYEGYQESSGRTGIPTPASPHRDEAPLQRPNRGEQQLYPEKQHIVPFDYARRIANKGGTRATASPANAIGNLTWLSQRQNGLDGFSNRWAVMDTERDRENLAARGMLWPSSPQGGSPAALELYGGLRDAVIEGRTADVTEEFNEFCRTRSDWMVHQMREWLEQPLPDKAVWWLGGTAKSA